MLDYPSPLVAYPKDWVEELLGFYHTEDLVALEKKDFSRLTFSSSLREFFERSEALGIFEKAPSFSPMPEEAWTFLYVIPKKQHEFRSLAPFVNDTFRSQKLSAVVDIGGGVGALAQTLNNQYKLPLHSVDMDPVLQKTGLLRHKKNAKDPQNMVRYHEHEVSENNPEFKKLLGPGIMTVGLHTCGELSLHQMKASIETKTQSLINFGCCYQRLVDEGTQNLSSFAQSLPTKIVQNKFGLTLAARAHRKTDEKDFNFKLKVKYFRYAFHLLLHDKYGRSGMATLGNSSKKLYDASFSEYALEQLRRLGLPPREPTELDDYFADPGRKELIRAMLAAGFIRNVFGRLLEAYLLVDRAIFMEESGYETKLLSFFDEEISPRNLGVVATLP